MSWRHNVTSRLLDVTRWLECFSSAAVWWGHRNECSLLLTEMSLRGIYCISRTVLRAKGAVGTFWPRIYGAEPRWGFWRNREGCRGQLRTPPHLQQPRIKLPARVLSPCPLLPVPLEWSVPFFGCLFCPPSQEADFKSHPGYQPGSGDCRPTRTLRLAGRASSLALVATGCQSPVRALRGPSEGCGDLRPRAWLRSPGAAESVSPSHCGCSKVVVRGLLPEQWWVLCIKSLCTRRWI